MSEKNILANPGGSNSASFESETHDLTPVYKQIILASAKRQADFKFFGHFLPRLSENDHS